MAGEGCAGHLCAVCLQEASPQSSEAPRLVFAGCRRRQGCCHKIPDPRLNNRHLFLCVLEARKFKVKVPADPGSGEARLPGWWTLASCCVLGEGLLPPPRLLMRRLTPSSPNLGYLPKAPPPGALRAGVGAPLCEFWGTQTFRPSRMLFTF